MAPEVCSLVDHHFVLEDGLKKDFRGNYETSIDVSLEQISRLLIERGDYPAVPINFEYPCGLVTGWPQWVDYELGDEAARIRLSEAAALSSVFISARCDINRDVESLRHVVRRWNPHTHTFVYEWGEFTPTLEDVLNIMRLPITGSVNPLGFDFDSEKLQVLVEGASSIKGSKRRFSNWVKHFWGVTENGVFVPGKGFDSGCRLEAMLSLWLTKFVFIEFSYEYVEERLFPLAIAIAAGSRFPLGPMFLGHVYRMLDHIVADELESVGRCGVTTLVSTTFLQVFIWERFKGLKMEPLTMSLSLELYNNDKEGSKQAQTEYLPPVLPLLCRWFKRRQDKTVFSPSMLDNVNNFIWQPYLQSSEFETFSFSGKEEQCTTALGRVELYMTVCPNFIPSISEDKEDLDIFPVVYSPDRVMRQVGCLQDVPSPPPRSLNSKITSFSHMERRCVLDFSGRIADFPSQLPGNAANANASPAYSCYWRGVLCRFRLFVEAGGPQLQLGPITSSRLASPKAVLTYAEKHNLTYTEVYSDGTRKVVGYLKGFEAKRVKGEGKKCDKKIGDKGDAREHNTQKPVRRFKPKVDFDKFMHTTQHGVKLMIPPSMPLQKNKEVKKKRSSTPRAGGTSQTKQANATNFEVKKRVKREVGVDFDVPLRRSNRVKSKSSPLPRGPPTYLELSDSDHGGGSQGGLADSSKEDHATPSKGASDHLPEVLPMVSQDSDNQVIEDEGMSDGDKAVTDDGTSDGDKMTEDEGMSDSNKVAEDEGTSDKQALKNGGVSNDNRVDAGFKPLQHIPGESENNDQVARLLETESLD
ncbi:uncharacterized protein LOC112193995 [Rosa chinensis]|uniref:uncharacterized protein LOC112193995 n=1 Tax=Rosa chinensis TaxID=74649 RepID=UPI000D08E7E8|nr:uncharacterized protein LOC112193995 [Rosa chinensis]